jgi:hypothetical protein
LHGALPPLFDHGLARATGGEQRGSVVRSGKLTIRRRRGASWSSRYPTPLTFFGVGWVKYLSLLGRVISGDGFLFDFAMVAAIYCGFILLHAVHSCP